MAAQKTPRLDHNIIYWSVCVKLFLLYVFVYLFYIKKGKSIYFKGHLDVMSVHLFKVFRIFISILTRTQTLPQDVSCKAKVPINIHSSISSINY